jgi:hypothetical protein
MRQRAAAGLQKVQGLGWLSPLVFCGSRAEIVPQTNDLAGSTGREPMQTGYWQHLACGFVRTKQFTAIDMDGLAVQGPQRLATVMQKS